MAYKIIRREARRAALAFGKTLSDTSFKPAYQYITVQLMVTAAVNSRDDGSQLRSDVASLFPDHRPCPSRPRRVKILKTRYPVDRTAPPIK
ncbi:MAG: hypothetical protein ACN6RK_09200 [Stenotrophomonas sp.]